MRDITPATNFIHTLMQSPPDASAWIAGGNNFPSISGLARFYATEYEGTLVEVEVFGLPNVAAPGRGYSFSTISRFHLLRKKEE